MPHVMNPAAVIATAAAAVNMATAALHTAVARAPGWRIARLFAVIAATAAAYNTLSAVLCIDGLPVAVYLGAGRLEYLVATLHCAAWVLYAYCGPDGGLRTAGRAHLAIAGGAAGFGLVVAAGGWAISDTVSTLRIDWVGVSYHYPLTTRFGDIYGLGMVLLLGVALARIFSRVRAGERALIPQLFAFSFLVFCAIDEALVANRTIHFISLADAGFVAVVMPVSWITLRRITADAHRLQEASAELQRLVVRRTEERDSAEVARHQAERHVQDLVASLDAIVWESDAGSLDLLFVSDGVFKLLGYTAEQWLQTRGFWVHHLHPGDRERAIAALRRAAAGDTAVISEYRMMASDGRFVWLRDSIRPVAAVDGSGRRLRGITVDITDSRHATEALSESEQRFRALFETTNDGVMLLRSGRFVKVNPKAEELFGRTSHEIEGLTPGELSPPRQPDGSDSQQRSVELIHIAEDGIPQRFRWVHLHRGGAPFTVDISMTSMVLSGEIYVFASLRDITRQLRMEEEFRQSQKMEAVGRLAGGIAHDFNNLLTIINGYGDLVLQRMKQGDRNRSWVAEMRTAGGRAVELVEQLLSFSRKQVIEPRQIDLNVLIEESGNMLRTLLGEDIRLVTVLAPALGCVTEDPGQFHQVLMNLAANARDAMPKGGTLRISTSNVELDEGAAAARPELTPGPYVLLEVADDGIGIDETTARQMFEPFFTTKPDGKGTGLGLATVYGIVRQNSGSISVVSQPGSGTTFRIYLPRTEAVVAKPEAAPRAPMQAGGGTILLVEDQPAVRRFGRDVLANCGYRVLEAGDGLEALAVAGEFKEPIDLVVTDVVMPGMNGQELVDRLVPLRPETRFLFMSGYAADVIAARGALDPGVELLAKPFSPEALSSKVREVLSRPRA